MPGHLLVARSLANMAAEVDINNLTEIEDIEKAYSLIQKHEVRNKMIFLFSIVERSEVELFMRKIHLYMNVPSAASNSEQSQIMFIFRFSQF